jgi:hypothetical protein
MKDLKEYNRIKQAETRGRKKAGGLPLNPPDKNRNNVSRFMENKEQIKINASQELAAKFRGNAKELKITLTEYLQLLIDKP